MHALDLAVIHDAKNILNEITLRLEQKPGFDTEVELLLHAGNRLTNLILWHKQQDQAMHLNIDADAPADLLKALCDEFSALFPHKQLNCMTKDAPSFWFYDHVYLRLALANALHNACHYAHQTIHLKAEVREQHLVFSIGDDGDGFPPQVIQNVMEQQLAETSRRGTGLGLVLASRIAELHSSKSADGKDRHGKVMLKNANGGIFELWLP